MSNMQNMLRQVQAMQRKMAKAEEELAGHEVSGSAGGGMVTVVADGNGVVRRVELDPQAVDPDDTEMLGDMIVAACNEALRAQKELHEELMGDMAGQLGLPPGLL